MRCITVRMSLSASLIELRREWWWWCTLRRGSLNRRRPQRSRDISSRSLCAMSLSHDYTIIALGSANIISIQQKPRSRRRHHRMIPIKGARLGYIPTSCYTMMQYLSIIDSMPNIRYILFPWLTKLPFYMLDRLKTVDRSRLLNCDDDNDLFST